MEAFEVDTTDGRTIQFFLDSEAGWFVRSPNGQVTRVEERPVVGFPILEAEYSRVRSAMLADSASNPIPAIVREALASSEYWVGRALAFLAAATHEGDHWPVEVRSAVQEASKKTELPQELRHGIHKLLRRLG